MSSKPKIYLSSPHLGTQEFEFVREAFATNWIAPLGPHVDGFEKELAHFAGVAHAAALSSGTAALHLALRLLGMERGDEVFEISAATHEGLRPLSFAMAEQVLAARIAAAPDENLRPVIKPKAVDDAGFTVFLNVAMGAVSVTQDLGPVPCLTWFIG